MISAREIACVSALGAVLVFGAAIGNRERPQAEDAQPVAPNGLRCEVVTVDRVSAKLVEVRAMFTNITGCTIDRARVTCVLSAADGRAVGFEAGYVVACGPSTGRPLLPQQSAYEDFLVRCRHGGPLSVTFKTDICHYAK